MREEPYQFVYSSAEPQTEAVRCVDPSEEDSLETETALRRRLPVAERLPFKLNIMMLGLLFVVTALSSGAGYFVLSNHLISQGFALNEAKERVETLRTQNRELELLVMQGESYDYVAQRVAELHMVSAGDIEYVEVKSKGVALIQPTGY